jgi:hypothetical protein
VLENGLLQAGVDGEESLLDFSRTSGCGGHRRGGSWRQRRGIDEHALDGTGWEGVSVDIEKPEPGSVALGDLGLEVDDVVGGPGTLTVGVDSSRQGQARLGPGQPDRGGGVGCFSSR